MSEATRAASEFQPSRRRAIKSAVDLVTIRCMKEDGQAPVVAESLLESLELATWAESNTVLIESLLRKHGGVLFRKFAAQEEEGLRRFTNCIKMELMDYMEGATPRRALGSSVYTSTEFPPEHRIALHNENSYVMTWPMKICFACVVAPEDRGETPIADVRKVLQNISPGIRRRFENKGYMLVRNFSEHLGLPWRRSFKVSTREEMERYCAKARIELEWRAAEHLRTRQVRPATAVHPVTHEPTWFNHIAFWHVSSLDKSVREVLLSSYAEEDLPYNTYYGDETRIEEEVVTELREAYDTETLTFPWKKGDVLLLDNMLVAHGRNPFSGPRKIIVSMGDPYSRTDM